jgi:tRNA (guanine10-N2)-methyltransferase
LLARKRAGQVNKLNLKTRPYLGPTSLVPELGLLMANQAKVQPVLDPFVGTGGIAIPATELGGFVLGGDIDIRVLKGKQGRNLGTCYKEYGLGIPELVRMDNHMR